jgi:hypothetical protein
MHAGEDPHQRRLAGSVLADKGVQFTKQYVEIHTIERPRCAEMFRNTARASRRSGHACGAPDF